MNSVSRSDLLQLKKFLDILDNCTQGYKATKKEI